MSLMINGGSEIPLENLYVNSYWIIDKYFGDRLWTCGYNGSGQLGDNTSVNKSSPVQTVAGGTTWKLATGGWIHTTAIKTDGTLWTWGRNAEGQLGDNTVTPKSSPIQTVTGGSNWRQVGGGYTSTSAIKTDGTLWTWGHNVEGQLGDNTSVNKSSPVQTVAGGTNWKLVAISIGYHAAAIKTDGTLWTWGNNAYGQLGDYTTVKKSSPVQTIAGGTDWKFVACGSIHTAAIKTNGTLWCWGYGGYGQLGVGGQSISPIQTTAGGTNWKSVACGYGHTAAIKIDGTLWMWGINNYGQLGDNTTTNKSSPVQTITGGTDWKQVAVGYLHNAAIKTDGTLWTWGRNNYGQLGDNSTADKSSPVQIISGGSNWKTVACGHNHTIAVQINNINTTGAE